MTRAYVLTTPEEHYDELVFGKTIVGVFDHPQKAEDFLASKYKYVNVNLLSCRISFTCSYVKKPYPGEAVDYEIEEYQLNEGNL